MLRKLLVPAMGLAFLPAVAQAQRASSDYGFDAGNIELTLGGGGMNDSSFRGVTWNVNGSLGYFVTPAIEVAVRQNVSYTDIGTHGGHWLGTTRVAGDYHFDMGQLQPFVGAEIGYTYGSGVPNTWEAGPEAGIKYFLNHTTFVQLAVEYDWFFKHGKAPFKDGEFLYSLALGVKF